MLFRSSSTRRTAVNGFTTGTPGDPGGNSHGDQFMGSPANPSIELVPTTTGDFSGRFVWDPAALVVSNNQTVGSSNLQATRLTAPGIGIGASVKDGPNVPDLDVCGSGTTTPAPPDVCSSLFGQNSAIYVAGDTIFETPFPVTVTFSKFELEGGINQNNIAIYHTWIDENSDFQEETIEDRCIFDPPSSPTPDNAQCLTATKSSKIGRAHV